VSEVILNDHHQQRLRQLAAALGVAPDSLPIIDRVKGWVFTEVSGVTVLITATSKNKENGGFIVPSLHTYTERKNPSNFQAAVNARKYYDEQLRELGSGQYKYDYGHRGPIVNSEWKCGDPDCKCVEEPDVKRRQKRSTNS
jgi:hypothetical protein